MLQSYVQEICQGCSPNVLTMEALRAHFYILLNVWHFLTI